MKTDAAAGWGRGVGRAVGRSARSAPRGRDVGQLFAGLGLASTSDSELGLLPRPVEAVGRIACPICLPTNRRRDGPGHLSNLFNLVALRFVGFVD